MLNFFYLLRLEEKGKQGKRHQKHFLKMLKLDYLLTEYRFFLWDTEKVLESFLKTFNLFFLKDILFFFFFFEAYGQGRRKGGLKIVGFCREMVTSGVKKVTSKGRIWLMVCVCVSVHAHMCVHARNTHVLYLVELEKMASVFLKMRESK